MSENLKELIDDLVGIVVIIIFSLGALAGVILLGMVLAQ